MRQYTGHLPWNQVENEVHKEIDLRLGLNMALKTITPRREYVIRQYVIGHTLAEIAKHFAVTVERARQMRNKGFEQLSNRTITQQLKVYW